MRFASLAFANFIALATSLGAATVAIYAALPEQTIDPVPLWARAGFWWLVFTTTYLISLWISVRALIAPIVVVGGRL
jgi:hypothetical protein